ncbi:phage tail protein [Enterobacter hormaechei subsp. xiangfangensis]|uniref:tail fiber assembly protein n=1 Tax=Enterobacter TaxID=547 RepID=UPI000F83221F|nr:MULTISPECIES: tail fiber assembly protein [Enterobacter]MBA7754761.1 phage tail protein [Enterobacter sp. RHBSTW-01064]MCC2919098.1 tail fiber assembly protein [Enterobacter hormaechei]RTM58816.1 phage tail protein [Enterobacter hormaechei subsp. xiangfangensis]UDV15027.1 tail fiber assembly protein [Enterobacter hormaechei]
MEYFYSASTNAFYPAALLDSYKQAGTLPDDIQSVGEDVFMEFTATQLGMRRVPNQEGFPMWEAIPAVVLTQDEIKSKARKLRDSFISATDSMLVSDYTINDTELTEDEREELMSVRLTFKKWPTIDGWPGIALPDIPQWLLVEAVNNGYRVYSWPEE